MTSVLPFTLGRIVFRARKRRNNVVVFADGVPSAMVEVQVSVDDDVDIVGTYADGMQIVEHPGRLAIDPCHLFREFVADPGLNQNILFPRADKQRIKSGRDSVLLVGCGLLRPEYLRHDTEKTSAIEEVVAVRNNGKLEIAKGCAIHGSQHSAVSDQPSGKSGLRR